MRSLPITSSSLSAKILWPEYKTSEGVEPELLEQFPLLEEVLTTAGVVVWPMIEFEADDALAAGAVSAAANKSVDRVIICTPDKDLAQCVLGSRVVQLNRRRRTILDETAIQQKFGVTPESILDYSVIRASKPDLPAVEVWTSNVRRTGSVSIRGFSISWIFGKCSRW